MISHLRGILLEKQAPNLILEVNGSLGYALQASMQTFYQLPKIGTEVMLYTHFLVREDGQSLYGFMQPEERVLFRALIKVSGIGPKVALAILSTMSANQLHHAITTQETQALQNVPGIGRKTAERLILELADKLKPLGYTQETALTQETATKTSKKESLSSQSDQQEAIQALIALGYKPQVASQLVFRIQEPNLSVEQLIRLALKATSI